MKRILMSLVLALATSFVVTARAAEELLKNIDGHHGTLVEKLGQEEGSRLSALVTAQQKLYMAAKEEGNLTEAARLTPFGHVEAHVLNGMAKDLLDEIDEAFLVSAKEITKAGERVKAKDAYYKSDEVVALLQGALELLDRAATASKSARAVEYRTVSKTVEQVVESLDLVDDYIDSNRLYTERCLGTKPWPVEKK